MVQCGNVFSWGLWITGRRAGGRGLASLAFYIPFRHRGGHVAGGVGRTQREMALPPGDVNTLSLMDGPLTSGGMKIKAKTKRVGRCPASFVIKEMQIETIK